MNELKELAYVVTRNKLKSIELLDTSRESRLLEFYDLLSREKLQSDEEALQHFFPDAGSTAPYRKLKSNLKKRLINALFFIDVKKPSYTNRQRAYYECHKEWAAAKMLLGKNAWDACIDICERILRHAAQYEFTEMQLDLLRILRLNYSTRVPDLKKFESYRDLHAECEQLLIAENRAELLYCELLIHFVNSRSAKEDLQCTAAQYYEEIRPDMERFSSYRLQLYGHMVRMMTHTIANDYGGTLQVCRSMISFFESKSYDAHTPLLVAWYQKLVCHLQLRDFEDGEKAAMQCMALIEEGTVNWFKYHELYFLLAMHTERYDRAWTIYQEITRHRRFRFLPNNVKEIWTIYESYLYYLVQIDRIELPAEETSASSFRLGRFLNEVPIFSKDKRGLNVAILTIQILLLIREEKYDQAIDRIEAIEKYCARYLHKDETIRSYYFIKMLLCIPAASFDPETVEEKAEKYKRKLLENSQESAHQTHKVEIVPYEKLWEFALASLAGTTV